MFVKEDEDLVESGTLSQFMDLIVTLRLAEKELLSDAIDNLQNYLKSLASSGQHTRTEL